jgi:hypothetical protein
VRPGTMMPREGAVGEAAEGARETGRVDHDPR